VKFNKRALLYRGLSPTVPAHSLATPLLFPVLSDEPPLAKCRVCCGFRFFGESVALLVARRTNNRKVVGSRPTEVVCITALTGNRLGWTVRCGRPPLLFPSCRKL